MPVEPDDFAERVLSAIRKYDLLVPGQRVMAAVSGGADSVCLLYVLRDLGYALEVAHFDHQTREGESTADAKFVQELAGRLSLPFHLDTLPVEEQARDSALSFEEYARKARYAFLTRIAVARDCPAMATGHHADDQAETVLMRIIRGTSPRGLAGIPRLREEEGVRIVRPLLDCTRDEILAFLERRGLAYCTDRTNEDTQYLRNEVRHELLPALCRDYNPKVRDALLRLGELQRCENELLDSLARSFAEECTQADGAIDRKRFAEGHPALERRAVLLVAWRYGVDCPFDRVDAAVRFIAEGRTGKQFDLGGGLFLRNTRRTTEVVAPGGSPELVDAAEVRLEVPGSTVAFGRIFNVTFSDAPPAGDLAQYCSPTRQAFDADAMGDELALRHRRPGDRFMPYGMTGSKKLKAYFNDIGLPVWERDLQLVLVAEGRIAWIVGHAIDAGVAVTAQTRRVLEVEVTHATQ